MTKAQPRYMTFTLDGFHNRLLTDWGKASRKLRAGNSWSVAAKKHAREYNHAGAWKSDDSFQLFYMDKGKLKSKTWEHAKPNSYSQTKSNPRGNYTTAEKKSIKRHTRKQIKRSGAAVRKMVAQAKRLTVIRKNPSYINRRKPKVSTKFYLIEGLVRESAHSRKFDYRYYTGTGFVGDRSKGFLFSTKSAADTGMRKIVNSLPKEILQIRTIPA